MNANLANKTLTAKAEDRRAVKRLAWVVLTLMGMGGGMLFVATAIAD